MNHLCSTACLLTRLDEPEPFVDASCDLCKEVSRVGIQKESRLLARIAHMLATSGDAG